MKKVVVVVEVTVAIEKMIEIVVVVVVLVHLVVVHDRAQDHQDVDLAVDRHVVRHRVVQIEIDVIDIATDATMGGATATTIADHAIETSDAVHRPATASLTSNANVNGVDACAKTRVNRKVRVVDTVVIVVVCNT